MDEILQILPKTIQAIIRKYSSIALEKIEEIRIRVQRPLEVIIAGKPDYPKINGKRYTISSSDAIQLLNKVSDYSLYAFEEELKRGYITIRGGHRIGLAGKVTIENGQVKAIKEIGSYNIRIARQKIGIAESYASFIYEKKWLNTLIIGPPQTGKTTLLRDFARVMSAGSRILQTPPVKVGIIDERSEIAGCVNGIPQHELGDRIDVLDACPKAEGMMMMIRSMSPDVLIVDEIGRREDGEAIIEAMNAGIQMMMTVHANSIEDLYRRPMIKPLLEMALFDRFIELRQNHIPGTVHRIRNQAGSDLMVKDKVALR